MPKFPAAMKTDIDSLQLQVNALNTAINNVAASGAGLPVFNVTSSTYGGVITASATSSQKLANVAALNAAYQAAALAAGGGIVYFPAGVFDIGATTGSDHSLELTPNNTAQVFFRGAGDEVSIIKLGGTVSAFLTGGAGGGVTYRNIHSRIWPSMKTSLPASPIATTPGSR